MTGIASRHDGDGPFGWVSNVNVFQYLEAREKLNEDPFEEDDEKLAGTSVT